MKICIAAYTLFLILLMVGLFIFGLFILSEWLKIQIPFVSQISCSSLRVRYCEEWRRTGTEPNMNFPENCPTPTYEECFGGETSSEVSELPP